MRHYMLLGTAARARLLQGWQARAPSECVMDVHCRFLSTVEAYDPRADAWRPLTALDAPRAYCAAATVNGGMPFAMVLIPHVTYM